MLVYLYNFIHPGLGGGELYHFTYTGIIKTVQFSCVEKAYIFKQRGPFRNAFPWAPYLNLNQKKKKSLDGSGQHECIGRAHVR